MAAGSIVIDLLMKTGAFETDTKRAEKRLQAMQKEVERTGKIIGTAIAAGAVAAVAGLTMMVNSQRQAIDEQAKLAQRLNTTYESLANLGRAGELAGVGMGQIEAASRQLDLNIGKAIQGTDAQVRAFERLGLSAAKIAELPLDQRIATINQALRDNVSAAERSAVAAELFGAKNAAATQALDPGTIAEAARQVEIFGLNLSDVDAAKVEMANDAMSTFGMLADGIGKQLTVELAPILKAIGDEFLRNAEEAGGLGNVVQDMVGRAVNGLAFVVDAADGVRRTFQIAGRVGAVAVLGLQRAVLGLADSIVSGPVDAVNLLIRTMNRLPGVSIEPVGVTSLGASVRGQIELIERAILDGLTDIQNVALEPLAGESLRLAFAAAQEAGQLAAAAAIEGRRANQIASEGAGETAERATRATAAVRTQVDTAQRQIDALVRQAATFNLSSTEAKLLEMRLDGATDAQLRQARALLESLDAMRAMNDETQRLNMLLAATPSAQIEKQRETMLLLADAFKQGRINAEQFGEAAQTYLGNLAPTISEAVDRFGDLERAIEGWGRKSASALTDFAMEGKASFNDFARSVIKDLIEMSVYQNLVKPLFGMMGAAGGPFGALGSMLFGGFRAAGGPVASGTAYVVGERGPELFVPNTAGRIVPNGAGGGGDMHVSIVVNAEGGGRQEHGNSSQAAELGRRIETVVRGVLVQERRPGGILAGA